MGRGGGGGFHGGFHGGHHSHYHSHSHSHYHSSGGGGGEHDMAVFFGVLIFFFAILAIFVPLGIYLAAGSECSPIDSLNRNEQAICVPDDLEAEWGVDLSSKGQNYIKVYRVSNSSLQKITRTYKWINYQESLVFDHSYFTVACPLDVNVKFDVSIEDKELDDLHFYWITKSQYYRALDDGYFYESFYGTQKFIKTGTGRYTWTSPRSVVPNTLYYMVFSSNWHSVRFEYDVLIEYTIYNVTGKKAEVCEYPKCVFNDMKKGEIIIADYPARSQNATPAQYSDPESLYVWLHDNSVNWVALFVCLGIFGGITLCLILALCVYLTDKCKKIRKLFKKIVKKSSSSSSSSIESTSTSVSTTKVTQMDTVVTPAAAPVATPGVTPGVAVGAGPEAAPPAYPVDPGYPGGAVAYPGQPENALYPVNPYPDGMPPDMAAPASDAAV